MREKIEKLLKTLSSLENIRSYKKAFFGDMNEERKEGEPKIEGISFRYKTVQFHIIDDSFEEIKKKKEFFGDVEIYSERFSLPEWGKKTEDLTGNEYQFEIVALIKSKTNKDTYIQKLKEVLMEVSKKHEVDVLVRPTEYYNVNHIVFFTTQEGVFSKD